MKKILLIVGLLNAFCASTSWGIELVTNATVTNVESTMFGPLLLNVTTSGGSGTCKNKVTTFAQDEQPTENIDDQRTALDRALGVALAAQMSGGKVTLHGNTCTDAYAISIN